MPDPTAADPADDASSAVTANPPPARPAPSPVPAATPPERYEATVHTTDLALSVQDANTGIAELDLDRVPDPAGGVRVLVDPNDISRLVAQGFEVRLQRAVPVQPLDPALIATDSDVDSWVAARMTGPGES